jgi:hypothetical protein
MAEMSSKLVRNVDNRHIRFKCFQSASTEEVLTQIHYCQAFKNKDKGRILKATREKRFFIYKGTIHA